MENYQKRLKENGLGLHPHQLEGVEKVLAWHRKGHGGIIADEMGLGKTCEAIAIIYIMIKERKQRPHLIISPLSVIDHWEKELKRFGCDQLNVVKLLGHYKETSERCRQLKKSEDWNVLLTTYEHIISEKGFFSRMRWSLVVVDEAQRIKNINSKLHDITWKQLHVDWTLLLTGTPLQNNVQELYSLLCLIDKKRFPIEDCAKFVKNYSQTDDNNGNIKVLEELRRILSEYMIRRLKDEILLNVPRSSQVTLYHGLSTLQKQLYKAIVSKNSALLLRLTGHGGRNALMSIMMQLRKCALHPYLFDGVEPKPFEEGQHLAVASGKMMLLARLLEYLKARKHRVILFSQMTRMLDIVEDYLNFRGWTYERIDGNVQADDRFEAVNNFQRPNSNVFCFLLSTRAGGLGLTLTGADTAVFIDADFNPQNDIQAAARCHRIGQTKLVKLIRLVTKNTVEDVIECYASKKLHMTNRILYSDELIRNAKLTAVELERMIMHGLSHLSDDDQDALNAASSMTDRDLERIIGKTDRSGNWLEGKEEEISKESDERSVGKEKAPDKTGAETNEVESMNKEEKVPNMYVFEGHDYKKERDALLKIVAENKELRKISHENDYAIQMRQILQPQQENVDDVEKTRLERARRAEEMKSERARKAAERRAKLWTDNGYVSTNLPLPNDENAVHNDDFDDQLLDGETSVGTLREGDGRRKPAESVGKCSEDSDRLDDGDESSNGDKQYGPYYVHGDVTKPLRALGDHCKHALIVHAVDNSGVFGSGGVLDALRKKDSRIPEAYELAAKMNDLRLGHAHLIANVGESVERDDSECDTAVNNDARSWIRQQSVVLLLVQGKKCEVLTRSCLFIESLQRVCAYARRVNARSVHFSELLNQMPTVHPYSVKDLIRKYLTDQRIHTYFYHYHRSSSPAKPQQLRQIFSQQHQNGSQQAARKGGSRKRGMDSDERGGEDETQRSNAIKIGDDKRAKSKGNGDDECAMI